MNDLVYLKNDEAVCDSLLVAEKFGKRHAHVIEKIEKIRIGKVRRAKLFFLRGLSGKKARIVEDLSATSAEKSAK